MSTKFDTNPNYTLYILSGMHPEIDLIQAEHRLMGLSQHDYSFHHTVIQGQIKEIEIRYSSVVEVLPSKIFSIKTLNILRLNNIKQIPDEIIKLKDLRLLEITRHESSELNPCICELQNLEVLIINRSEIESLPGCLVELHNLRDFDLINNNISKVPELLIELPELRYLSLAGFEDTVEELISKLSKISGLIKLFLGKFKRPIFPEVWHGISKLTNLTNLTISGYSNMDEELIYVSPEINNLVNLESLWIDGAIMCFPDIPDLENLEELYLFANALQSNTKSILNTKIGMCINPDCPIHPNKKNT